MGPSRDGRKQSEASQYPSTTTKNKNALMNSPQGFELNKELLLRSSNFNRYSDGLGAQMMVQQEDDGHFDNSGPPGG